MSEYITETPRGQIYERNFEFLETGGYVLNVKFEPKNKWVALLAKLRLLKPQRPIAEIDCPQRGSDYIPFKQYNNSTMTGYFNTLKGQKAFRLTVDSQTANEWNVTVTFSRLYS